MAVDLTGTPDAELDNSLLVRLIEEADTIGDYAVSVSMIEIVDEDSGDVLQTAELDGIREIQILTGEGDDRVRIDVGSFGDQSLPSISLDGGVGNDELVLDGGAGSQNWTIDGVNSGALDGVVDGTFDDVETIIGADTTDDHFTLSDQGSLSGGLEGGDGGYDVLTIDVSQIDSLSYVATGSHSGGFDIDGNILAFDGLEPVEVTAMSGLINIEIDTSDAGTTDSDNQAILRENTNGMFSNDFELVPLDGSFESLHFDAPSSGITIDMGDGDDVLFVGDLGQDLTSDLTLQGGEGNDMIIFRDDLTMPGQALVANAETISVGWDYTISQAGTGWDTGDSYSGVSPDSAKKSDTTTDSDGSGLLADIYTDDSGDVFIRITDIGEGYEDGDILTFDDPDGSGVSLKITLDFSAVTIDTRDLNLAGDESVGNSGNISLGLFVTQNINYTTHDLTEDLVQGDVVRVEDDETLLGFTDNAFADHVTAEAGLFDLDITGTNTFELLMGETVYVDVFGVDPLSIYSNYTPGTLDHLYEYIGPDDLTFDLTTANFNDGTKWLDLGDADDLPDPFITGFAGAGMVDGLYEFKLATDSDVDLNSEDFTDSSRWTFLGTIQSVGQAAEVIVVNDNSKLLAGEVGTTAFDAGDVRLKVEQVGGSTFQGFADIDTSDVSIIIGTGVEITGDVMELNALADNSRVFLDGEIPEADADGNLDPNFFLDSVTSLVTGLEGFSLFGGVAISNASATIDVADGASFVGGSFSAIAEAEVEASSAPIGLGLGVAVAVANSNANVTFAGDVNVSGDIYIRSGTDNTLDARGDAGNFPVAVKGASIGVAVTVLESNSTAWVTDAAMLTAGGLLTVRADTVDRNVTLARSRTDSEGTLGIGVAVKVENGETNAWLDGTASAGTDVVVEALTSTDTIDTSALFILPSVVSGVSAVAGVGTDSTGDLLKDSQNAITSSKINTLKEKVGAASDAADSGSGGLTSSFDFGAAVAIEIDKNVASARIGDSDAAGGSGKVVAKTGDVTVRARVENRPDITAASSATQETVAFPKPEGATGSKFGGSAGVAVGEYVNDAQAHIGDGAAVDAAGALTVSAEALNDYTPQYLVDLFEAATAFDNNPDIDYDTTDTNVQLQEFDIVRANPASPGLGTANHAYRYIGSDPLDVASFAAVDFTDATAWEDLGLLDVDHYSRDGSVVVQDEDIVRVSQEHPDDKGEEGELYRYIGSSPGASINLSVEDFTDDTEWESIGAFGATETIVSVIEELTGYFNSNLGVNGGLVDSWSQATASSDGLAVAAAVTVLDLDSIAKAWIGDNAQINQDTSVLTGVARTGGQTVTVTATSIADAVHFAGNIALPSISTGGSSTGTSTFNVNPTLGGVGSSGGKGGVGITVLVILHDNEVAAEVRSGAVVYADKMDVVADSSGMAISVTGSGGKSDNFGFNGVVSVFNFDNSTHAVVETGAQLTIGSASVTPTSMDIDQSLNVSATDSTQLIQLTGALSLGSGVGVGATVSVNTINRDTRAVIGNADIAESIDGVDDDTQASTPSNIAQTVDAVGDVSVSAINTGLIVAVAISASVKSDASPDADSATNPGAQTNSRTGSKFGAGVSANVSINNVSDTALAYVHDANIDAASLDIDASNDTSIWAFSGSVAVTVSQGTSASLAGAYSQNTIDLRTLAMMDNADAETGTGAITMDAVSASGILSIGVSGAVSTSSNSLSIAGQVSYNDIDMMTSSRVVDSNVDGGSLSLTAYDESEIFSIAGAVAFGGKAGIGASVGVNLISDFDSGEKGISAFIKNSDVDVDNDVSLSGFSGTQIIGVAAAVSAATGPLAASVAVVVNEIDVTTQVFIEGKLLDGLDAGGDVYLSAYDNAAIGSVAGGVGISGGAAGIGASVAVNTITNDTSAKINGDADVDVDGHVIMSSTSDSYILSVAIAGAGASTAAFGGSVAINSVGTTADMATTEAVIGGSAQIVADGNVILASQNNAILTTIAGAVAIAGTAGVGVSNSTVVTAREVRSEIKGTAKVTALGNSGADTVQVGRDGQRFTDSTFRGISVTAEAELDVVTIAIGGAGGGSAAVAGSATVSTIDDSVAARVTSNTKLNENNSGANVDQGINIFAYNQTEIIGSAGGVSGSGTFGGTAGADVGVIDKSTIAELSSVDANARDLISVQAVSKEDVVSLTASVAVGGTVGLAGAAGVYLFGESGTDPIVTRAFIGANADIFTEGTVVVAADQSTNADFFVGGVSASLGGAVGATAGVSVINKLTEAYIGDDATVIARGASGRDTGQFALGLDDATYSNDDASDENEVSPPSGLSVGDENDDGTADSSNESLFKDRNVNVDYEARNGISVTATNTDEFEALIVAVGGGAVSGQVAALVVVGDVATHAYIDNNATVTASGGAGSGNVNVAALNDYHAFFIAAPISVSLAGGVSAGAAVNVLSLDTRAVIGDDTDIDADHDVRLIAESDQDILVTAASVGVSGGIGVALAGVYVDLTSTTQAYVRDDTPDAAGNDTGIDKDGDNDNSGASIKAGHDVIVSADDDTSILNIGGALGVGIGGGGVGAGFTVATISKDTVAYIGDYAEVDALAGSNTGADLPDTLNSGRPSSLTGVIVAADSSEIIDSFAVAAAGGSFVGVAGAVSVIIVDSDTTAGIANNTKINTLDQANASTNQEVFVGATNRSEFFSIGAGLSVSLGGSIGAGVDIGVVRNDVSAFVGGEVNAKDRVVIDADSEKTLLSVAATASVGVAGIAAAVSVWSVGSDFSESDVTGRTNEDNDSVVSGDDLDDVEDLANDNAVPSDLTSTLSNYGDDNSSGSGDNSDPENDALMSGAMGKASTALSGSSPSISFSDTTSAPGVSAYILAGADIDVGNDIVVEADENIQLNVLAGGAAAGLVGFGASVSVVNVSSNVQAYVEDGANAASGARLETGGSSGDDITLRANYYERTTVTSFAGQAGLVGAGGALVFVDSNSAQSSYIGNHTNIVDAGGVILDSDADIGVTAQTLQASVGLVSAGISVATANAAHSTTASTGTDVTMGSDADKIRTLDITADSTISVTADATVIGASLAASVSANSSTATSTSTVRTELGARTDISASGDVLMRARASGDVISDLQGTTVSGLASIASSNATAIWTNTVTTELKSDVEIVADDVEFEAFTNHNASGTLQSSNKVSAEATSSSAAALAFGAGTVVDARQITDAKVTIGAGVVITAASLTGTTKTRNNVDAMVDDLAAGVIGVGIPIANALIDNESEVTTKDASSSDKSIFNISGTFRFSANSDSDADAIIESEAYGLGAASVGSATTTLSRNDVFAFVGKHNQIGSDTARTAKVELLTDNAMNLDAEMEITAAGAVTSIRGNATVNAGGAGAADGLNKVGIDDNSEVYATDVEFYAKDDGLDIRARADSDVDFALGGNVDAYSIGDVRSETLVFIGADALIDAEENVDLFSKQFGVKTDVDALTAILGASGNLTSDATADIRANSNITAESGAVVTGRFIDVVAETQQFSGDYSRVAETDAETVTQLVATVVGETCSVVVEIFTFGLADGDEVCEPVIEFVEEVIQADSDAFRRGSEVKQSTITWNADVNVRSELNPFIHIDENGVVTGNVTGVSVDNAAETVTIPDIRNTSTGTLRFNATGGSSKILSTEPVIVNLLKSYESVTIINESDYDLVIQGISVWNKNQTVNDISIDVAIQTDFPQLTSATFATASDGYLIETNFDDSVVDISATGTGDILFKGADTIVTQTVGGVVLDPLPASVENPGGTTNVTAANGDILMTSGDDATLHTRRLNLLAVNGQIGETKTVGNGQNAVDFGAIRVELIQATDGATPLDATFLAVASGDIDVEITGIQRDSRDLSLYMEKVESTSGDVDLTFLQPLSQTSTIQSVGVTQRVIDVVGGTTVTFDATTQTTDTFTSTNHGFESGDLVVYRANYSAGTPINFQPGLTISNDEIDFGVAHGLSTGQAVIYSADANSMDAYLGTEIGGLTDGGTYFVISTGTNTIKLAVSYDDAISGSGVEITLDADTAQSAQTFSPSSITTAAPSSVFDPSTAVSADLTVLEFNPESNIGESPAVAVFAPGIDVEIATTEFTFDPANAVDAADIITLTANHGYETGDVVVYSTGSTAIGGLTSGVRYYAIVVSDTTLKLAANRGDALAGTAIDLNETVATGTDHMLQKPSQDTIRFAQAHDFANAEAITYDANGFAPVGSTTSSLMDGGVYYAIVIDANTIQLAVDATNAGTGTAIALDPEIGFGSGHSFTGSVGAGVVSDGIDFGAAHNLSTGDAVVYSNGGGGNTSVGGLVSGQTYYVIFVDSDTIKLATSNADATNGTAIDLDESSAAVVEGGMAGGSHSLTIVSSTAPNAITTSGAHGFSTGDVVIYSHGGDTAIGGLVDGASYYVIEISNTVVQLAATLADANQGKAIDLDEMAATGTNHSLTAPQADPADMITFASAHGFTSGQAVQYIRTGGSTDVGGLNSDGTVTYYVIVISDTQIQLAASRAAATGFNTDGTPAGVNPIDLDGTVANGSSHTIVAVTSDHSLTPSGDIGGLVSGQTYEVANVTNDTFQLVVQGGSTTIALDETLALGTAHTLIGDSYTSSTVQRSQITFSSSDADADILAWKPGDTSVTGIKAAGDISVSVATSGAGNVMTDVSLTGNIDGSDTGRVDIRVTGLIDVDEVSGDFRIGTIRTLNGDITLRSVTGDIISVTGGSLDIYSDTPGIVTLISDLGAVGEALDSLKVDSESLVISSKNSVWVDETDGNMNVTSAMSSDGNVTLRAIDTNSDIVINKIEARKGVVTLTAERSILDHANDAVVDIEANTIDLEAKSGSIGVASNGVEVDSSYTSSGLITLDGVTGATIEEVAAALNAGAMVVSAGVLALKVRDSSASGEDYVQAGSDTVSGSSGVTIQAGDNLTLGANASITSSAGNISLFGDFGTPDPDGAGTIMSLNGIVSANGTVSILTGDDADTVTVAGSVTGGGAVMLSTGEGNDIVTVSLGGILKSTGAALTFDTGDGADDVTIAGSANGVSAVVQMKDGNDDLIVSGSLAATGGLALIAMDGLGDSGDDTATIQANASVTATGALNFEFGNGTNLLDIDGTASGQSVLVASGAGVDTVDVAGNSLTTTNGNLIMLLGSGADVLTVTGLVQATGGKIDINTGSGVDTVTISGTVDASGDLILKTEGGDDTLAVQSTGLMVGANVVIDTGAQNDTVRVLAGGLVNADTGRFDLDLQSGADELTVNGELRAVTELDITSGIGTDTVFVDGELDAPMINLATGAQNDLVTLDGADLNGSVDVSLGDGNDTFRALLLPTPTEIAIGDITVDGGAGSDDYYISLTGISDYRMTIADTGDLTAGVDELDVLLTNNADIFLIRENFMALLQDGMSGLNSTYERIDYDGNLNERVRVRAFDGDDAFYVDDTSAVFTIDGGLGADAFQIGQVFGHDPNVDGNLVGEDAIAVQPLDSGFLSRGISLPMVIYGGEGNDDFSVFSNKADLRLEGEGGDDNFVVRAFVLGTDITEIDGGVGSDFIQYNINSPVSIEGGDGTDQVIVVGTNQPDNFLITRDGIFGAGLSVTFSGVEVAKVDGLEGDDKFFIQSTNKDVLTIAVGGLGSDTFNVTGDITGTIQASELDGARSSVNHGFNTTDMAYSDAGAVGIDLTVANAVDNPITVTKTGADTSVFEDDALSIDSYDISLTSASSEIVYVTISASLASSTVKGKDLFLTFDSAAGTITNDGPDWAALGFAAGQTIEVVSGTNAGNYQIASLSGTVLTVVSGTLTDITETSDVIGTKVEDEGSQTIEVSTDGGSTWARASILEFAAGETGPKSVIVRAMSDIVQEGLTSVFIAHDAQSADAKFDDAAISSIEVLVRDDDVGGVQIVETDGGTHVLEGVDGVNDSYTIRLTKAPTADVTVVVAEEPGFDGYLEFSLDGATWNTTLNVDFDETDWQTDKTVFVRATLDSDAEDDRRIYVQHSIVSTDTLFNGADTPEVVVLAQDDDKAGLFVSQTDGDTRLIIGDSAATDRDDIYTIRLTQAPTESVSVQLLLGGKVDIVSASTVDLTDDRLVDEFTTDADGNQIAVKAIVFTADNWDVGVEIKLSGNLDANGTISDTAAGQNLHLANAIEGQIDIIGGVEFGSDFSLTEAVVLPYEDAGGIPAGDTDSSTTGSDETESIDAINLYDDSSDEDQTGYLKGLDAVLSSNLTFSNTTPEIEKERSSLTGLDMRIGISFRDIEIAEVLLGDGNDMFLVDGRHQADGDHGGVIVVHGAGGGDTITVRDGTSPTDGSDARVVIFGDTSEDAERYDATRGVPSDDAIGFVNPGNDTIDASGATFTVAIDGGDGDDILTGSSVGDHIAGGRGNDTITAGDGADHIYGDNAFNFATYARDLTVVNLDEAGNDEIDGGEGANIVFGDMGQIDQLAGTVRLDTTAEVIAVLTTVPALGGVDRIRTGNDDDIVLGGNAGDEIDVSEGNDIVLGDHGVLTGETTGWTAIYATDDAEGGRDSVLLGGGNDIAIGGAEMDLVFGEAGNDLIFGDFGRLDATPDNYITGDALPLDTKTPTFEFTSIFTTEMSGAGDILFGDGSPAYDGLVLLPGEGDGDDIILGGQGGDVIHGGYGNDDLIGGHNVAGGHDGGDRIDGGGGADAIAGDNAEITRKADAISPRFRELTNTGEIYGEDGDEDGRVLVETTYQANPDGISEQTILILDAAASAMGSVALYGDDFIAGGADDDTIFGQFGNDTIQGDGGIGGVSVNNGTAINEMSVLIPTDNLDDIAAGFTAGAERDGSVLDGVDETTGLLNIDTSFGVNAAMNAANDGDDYIEGNAGEDVIFGNLGRDDIIGGSSDLYGLTDPAERPDGNDFIFGGAGTQIDRDSTNDLSNAQIHGRDSDVIVGDNGNIYRLVEDTTENGPNAPATAEYLTFAYDTYGETTRLLPRAVEFLDYTEGDPSASGTIGGNDEIHGEDGDDTAYGMSGNDVLFGERQNDDLIGGTGNDWISGGAGVDGVIGDDGRIYTSRNGTAEDLYGISATSEEVISTRQNGQYAVINVTGELNKSVNITPFEPTTIDDSFDDIIFGGLGDDFLHGAAGDDAISGAEAIDVGYAIDRAGTVYATGYLRPYAPGDILDYGVKATGDIEFWLFDENNPLVKITLQVDGADVEFFLNNNALEGPEDPRSLVDATVYTDGDDRIFGDLGNDWLVGGTGRDNLYGGRGGDLLNVDDDLTSGTNGDNQATDTSPGYEDRAFGGAGQDILIGNTGGDRLIDWSGEFNSYFLPFSAYGEPTVSRLLSPVLPDFLYALSEADGADQTLGTGNRNGEPFGELGLVTQKDADWNNQTGAPVDPQPGTGNAPRDVNVTAAAGGFNDLTSPNVSGDFGAVAMPLTAFAMGTGGDTVSQSEAEAAFEDAVNWWSTYDPSVAALLRTVDVVVADLDGLTLAQASDGVITVDADAAGHGWFFDATPDTDDDLTDDEMDLFSAMVHEIGHLLGYEHGDSQVMEEVLFTGVRTATEETEIMSAQILPFSTPAEGNSRAPKGMIDQTPALSRGPMVTQAKLGNVSFLMDGDTGDLVPDFDLYDPHERRSTFEFDAVSGLLVKSG